MLLKELYLADKTKSNRLLFFKSLDNFFKERAVKIVEDPMKILVEGEELRNYPDNVRLLLAIALYEVTPYSWEKIAEILGFSPVVLRERLRAFGIPLYKYTEEEVKDEIETARGL
jgi:predicted HTH domain antitoxin